MARLLFVLLATLFIVLESHAFCPPTRRPRSVSPLLFMAKGLNRAKNKQAEMLQKLELAKKQNQKSGASEDDDETELTKKDDKDQDAPTEQEYNRLLFAELLAKSQATRSEKTLSEPKSEGPVKVKAKQQPKRNNKSQQQQNKEESNVKHDAPLQQGNVAKRRHFESLVELSTNRPLGAPRPHSLYRGCHHSYLNT